MTKSGLSVTPKSPVFSREEKERRQRNDGPPDGQERRRSDADRRTENNEKYLTFKLGGQYLGISVGKVQEVLPHQNLTPVPRASASIEGLLNLRGQIVTAVNLRKRLELQELNGTSKPMYVIVNEGGELFSLLVDEVGDVIEVANSRFNRAPASLDECWKACCDGVYQLSTGLLIALDVSKLLKIDQGQNSKE